MFMSLLTRGFLPRELPPLFTSNLLGAIAGNPNASSGFTNAKARWTQPVEHNLALLISTQS